MSLVWAPQHLKYPHTVPGHRPRGREMRREMGRKRESSEGDYRSDNTREHSTAEQVQQTHNHPWVQHIYIQVNVNVSSRVPNVTAISLTDLSTSVITTCAGATENTPSSCTAKSLNFIRWHPKARKPHHGAVWSWARGGIMACSLVAPTEVGNRQSLCIHDAALAAEK